MAFQAGVLNVGGFMACHRFVSHVTGYGTSVGYELGLNGLASAFEMALVPICFLLGCMMSGFLVDIRIKLHKKPRYYISFGLIFALIATVMFFGESDMFGKFGEPLKFSRDYTLLVMLAFLCGVQNGTITTVSRSVIRTTHLSGITTDLGIGLARLVYRKKIASEIPDEGKAVLMRMGIIGFFITGSYCGYEIFSRMGYIGFTVPLTTSGILFIAMLYFQFLYKK